MTFIYIRNKDRLKRAAVRSRCSLPGNTVRDAAEVRRAEGVGDWEGMGAQECRTQNDDEWDISSAVIQPAACVILIASYSLLYSAHRDGVSTGNVVDSQHTGITDGDELADRTIRLGSKPTFTEECNVRPSEFYGRWKVNATEMRVSEFGARSSAELDARALFILCSRVHKRVRVQPTRRCPFPLSFSASPNQALLNAAMDYDEYAAYDLSEYTFTSADLDALDAQAAAGGPAVPIELERATDSAKDPLKADTSTEAVRTNGTGASAVEEVFQRDGPRVTRLVSFLSIRRKSNGRTALTSYERCEVQFDYGLRQGRSRKLADRPASFTSAKGKVINVVHHVAEMNDKTQKRGTSVHKKLEKELRPVEVKVTTGTEEERWALRMVQMLACLDDLRDHGKCREMPVFGILHDAVVIGIIDEVSFNSHPTHHHIHTYHAKERKSNERSRSPTQTSIMSFLSPSFSHRIRTPSPPPSTASRPLYISDTKTRRTPDLPPDDDTLPARLQLMFYHALLSSLLAPTFPFAELWTRFELDPYAPLSDAFLAQTGLIPDAGETADPEKVRVQYPCCLDELEDVWRAAVQAAGIIGVAEDLMIVYRTQQQPQSPKEKAARTLGEILAELAGVEGAMDLALQQAISNSLLDAVQKQAQVSAAAARAAHLDSELKQSTFRLETVQEESPSQAETQTRVKVECSIITESEVAVQEGAIPDTVVTPPVADVPSPAPASDATVEVSPCPGSGILGTKVFHMNSSFMGAYLTSVLEWWYGQRAPIGVDVQHARRCRTCEYREDCEWRESKAAEAAAEYRKKNGRSPSAPLM
ncbi:hypothetical protein EVG20_g9956 [Dentipellis fragilis]|uniref:Exonuclease V n=1 Tax=Dentipellis fragilis TaxID=205917 RepID=A0A4Y9XZ05_9AGAM|nr:hypothetical protein EVG20_g9956 [Dentipellis fragilis]